MNIKIKFLRMLSVAAACINWSCQQTFLDRKPDRALAVPVSLEDLDALLNNEGVVSFSAPALQQLSGDEFYLEDNSIRGMSVVERNSYLWADDFYEAHPGLLEWNKPYEQVFYSNIVLDRLSKIITKTANQSEWKRIKGTALFFRAVGHFHVAQLYAEQYDPARPDAQPGIPLRLTSDVNDRPGRGTLRETYRQILGDLEEAERLVPEVSSMRKTKPDKTSVRGMLARVYLTLEDYSNAGKYADMALQLKNGLMDFNEFDPSVSRPIPTAFFDYDIRNVEVLHFFSQVSYMFNLSNSTYVNPELFGLYGEKDLRRHYYFKEVNDNHVAFAGNFNGLVQWFSGLTTAEMYLIRAECRARAGDSPGSLLDLNRLLRHRMEREGFTEVGGLMGTELLTLILDERRKELVARGIRWSDLRGLNRDVRFAKTI